VSEPVPKVVPPDTEELWQSSIECRYRNLYEPFGLGRECATSVLDSPRNRPDVVHRVAVIDGRVVGTGRLDVQADDARGPSAQIRYCAVDKAWRGRGVGEALIRELERAAAEVGVRRVWMEARVVAVGFYARTGYVDAGEGDRKSVV